jgi:hypothetical protein
MSLESDLYAYVVANATVANQIGTRFFPNALFVTAKNFTSPSATYMRVSTRPINATSQGRLTLTEVRMQVDTFGLGTTGYAEAKDAALAIRNAIQDFTGTMGSTAVEIIRLEDYEDHPDKDLGINENRPFRIRMDFTIWCRET